MTGRSFRVLVVFLCSIHALARAEALDAEFTVPDDLRFDLLLKEPQVRQPVNIGFDERGRMWVVQYLQYPDPAGLKILSRDSVWRVQYDKIPSPPPHGVRGADKITIFEDTDGDGRFDKEKTFVEGLNIATSVCCGRGGVFVTNPPYLLFYPDRNNDDIPDGDPEVLLEGFGLEDTHSVINSLSWGPDGWLYGAQGSTVTSAVKRPGSKDRPVRSIGQCIWRYHPEMKRYEVFAEGGGNAFGVEFDREGRVFSGHNGGNTRGFHYVQGGYFQKGFDKHGPLSNPYAFGYFSAMKHPEVQRFTHTFVIYDGDALPDRYQGVLFGVAPLLHHVVMSKLETDGSSFKTHDIGYAAATKDTHFIPVDIKQGPDGALYVADWYDDQCNHYRNHEGQIDKSTGRIYRLSAAAATARKPEDLTKVTSRSLVERLKSSKKWQRQTALRLLADRRDASVGPLLKQQLSRGRGQLALESLWALNLVGSLDEPTRLAALDHANPQVRLWTVRLIGDRSEASDAELKKLVKLARIEHDPEVCCQIASSARRLPAKNCLQIVRQLLEGQNADDPRLPMLAWWAIEDKVAFDPQAVVHLFRKPAVWHTPIAKHDITERLMRRFAATGHRSDLAVCAELLRLAPEQDDIKRLMIGFEAAYAGRPVPDLPNVLASALDKFSGTSIVLALRQRKPAALDEALKTLRDDRADKTKQIQYVDVLGQVNLPAATPVLIALSTSSPDSALQTAALHSLSRYDDPRIPSAVLTAFPNMSDDVRIAAASLLTHRPAWTLALLRAIESHQINKTSVPPDIIQRMGYFSDSNIHILILKLWPDQASSIPEDRKKEIDRISGILESGMGHPKNGKTIFTQQCSKCHKLFGQGGEVGPDLTSFNRNDLNTMLLSIVHPSAESREGYNSYLVTTNDGRTLTGTLAEQDNQTVTLRSPEGQSISIPREEIDEMTVTKQSMMPEGLLKVYSDQQLRDLFAYLRMTQPLIDR